MSNQNNQLLKLLGLGFGVAVTVGGTIGTGILRKPGQIAALIGEPWIIMLLWLAVGIYALLGVLCAIELAVSMPQAGSWYVYAKRAFGNYFGFVTGITSWFGTVAALGFGAYTMSEYIGLLLPSTTEFIQFIAIFLLIILTLFHWLGTKSAGKSQEILALIKGLGLLIFVIVCFIFGSNPTGTEVTQVVTNTVIPMTIVSVIGALQAIFYTYDGWHTATYFTEENANPVKTLPKSMLMGVVSIIVIYLLVNGAILYVLPADQLANSKLAAADAISYIFGDGYSKIITLFLMISILGIVNAQIMFAPRVVFSMGRDGLFFKATTKVNAMGTPSVAMPLTALLSILLIISGKDTCDKLSNIATFFFVLSYAAGFAALIKLRYDEPELSRPFKAPWFPYLPILLIVLSLLFLCGAVYSDIDSSIYALVFLVISYPLFLLIRKLNND
ncbi:MAG TPA: amino acid permease [Saprospiraceae bacterium]|nr:amino acid permease [Saprospiraceae bacterium]